MAITPDSEQIRALTRIERVNFRLVHFLNQSNVTRRLMTFLGSTLHKTWVELGTSRTVMEHGFEHFKEIDSNRAVLLAANHRSFYDLFVITARLFRLYGAHHHVYFPVRSEFFYDNLIGGILVNLPVALAVMYPPIVRQAKRRRWNLFAMDLMVDLLEDKHNMVGIHPEGTRNQNADPYSFLPAKPGCGELIYRANPNVIPVFLQGFPKSPLEMLKRNLGKNQADQPLVHMVMGPPMDFAEEREWPSGMKTYLRISRKVMARIRELGKEERALRSRFN